MPYKSEKIKISGTPHDRRQKLTLQQKEEIRWLYAHTNTSQRKLAKQFGVSRRLITFILDPGLELRNKEALKQRKARGLYKVDRKQWAAVMREHRHYKQQLFLQGEIKFRDNLKKRTMKEKTIDFKALTQRYPGFIFIVKYKELCGYNPQTEEYLVIDDGMCCNVTGTWLVNLYKIIDPAYNPFDERKYCDETEGIKIAEKWVCLSLVDKEENPEREEHRKQDGEHYALRYLWAQREINIIKALLIQRLCWIKDPEKILPHMVFIENVNDLGEPEFQRCTLEAINSQDQTCTFFNHATNERETDWHLSAINIDWLAILWEWYKQQPGKRDAELFYEAEKKK